MKILYITGMSSAKYGGFEKFNVELLRQGADMVFIYNSIFKDIIHKWGKLQYYCNFVLASWYEFNNKKR